MIVARGDKMKKIGKIFVLSLIALLINGCGNKTVFDTTYTFRCALVRENDGSVSKYNISNWTDYEGEQLQIKFDTGETRLINSVNVELSTYECSEIK